MCKRILARQSSCKKLNCYISSRFPIFFHFFEFVLFLISYIVLVPYQWIAHYFEYIVLPISSSSVTALLPVGLYSQGIARLLLALSAYAGK